MSTAYITTPNHSVSSVEFRRSFGKHIKIVEKGERLTLNRNGKPVAIVIPVDEYETLQEFDGQRAKEAMKKKILADTALAVKNLRGMIKDDVTDTSEKVDEILYGQELDD